MVLIFSRTEIIFTSIIPIAIVGVTHFFAAFEDILSEFSNVLVLIFSTHFSHLSQPDLIGYWAASYSSTVLCEHFIFQWNDFLQYHIPDWNMPSNLLLGIAAVLAFLWSFTVIMPSMDQPWYTGLIADAGTGDIGLITGFFTVGILYVVCRVVEARFSARRRNEVQVLKDGIEL